jgi:hypothetical protein
MNLYQRWMWNWERRLTLKDPHRRIHPFGWGLEWLPENGDSREAPLYVIKRWAQKALGDSSTFFGLSEEREVEVGAGVLRFQTPTETPIPENNRVECRFFEKPDSRSAVLVIPQWNAAAGSHMGLCRVLRWMGYSVVRLTLPYHEGRCPKRMWRADYMVGPNIGRTLHAVRQAVLEARLVVRWLKNQGYSRVGIVGTSLGSCIAYLTFAHDQQIDAGVFNHVSAHFGQVVWTGLATRYVLWGLEGFVRRDDLLDCWAPLSPWHYIHRLEKSTRPHLLISAKYDLTFLPEETEAVFERYRQLGISFDDVELPCGHYTTACFPFKYLVGWHICSYLRRYLGEPSG